MSCLPDLRYVTTDQVNARLAQKHVYCTIHEARDGSFPFGAHLIMDMDSTTPSKAEKDQILPKILEHAKYARVAVHSYNLTRMQRQLLRKNGVIVARRLSPKLIDRLLGIPICPVKTPASIGSENHIG